MNRLRLDKVILLIFLILFASCGKTGNKSKNRVSKNDSVRIVCASKQLTELVYALGEGDKLVGVDLSSTYPPQVTKLPNIGYHMMLNAEGIISLHPTVFIYNGGTDAEIGPDNVIPQLKEVGITIKKFRTAETMKNTYQLIRDLGSYFHVESRADSLCANIKEGMKQVEKERKKYQDQPKVMVIHFGRAHNVYFPIGPKGTVEFLLTQAGGVNAITSMKFRLLSPEVLAEDQPQVILATSYGVKRLGGIKKFEEIPGISLTPAAKNNKIFSIDEHDLLYLGPRTPKIILKIMKLIHQ